MDKNRTYERTHSFISFELDLTRLPPSLWILLGEAQSKCQHLRGVPLPPKAHERLNALYLVKGVRATTAIEGNTLSEDEVKQHIEGTLALPRSKEYLQIEIQNILDVCNDIWEKFDSSTALSAQLIKRFNAEVLKKLELDEEVVPGEFRKKPFGVAGYRGAPSEDIEYLTARLCDWMNSERARANPEASIVCAIMRAIIAHLYIEWIHPFGDGNGRTGRLVEFFILVQAGVPQAAAHLLSNHYNITRTEYYRQLDRASKSGGDVRPFLQYAVQGFVDGLREQLKVVQDVQLAITWRDFVRARFTGKNTAADARRRLLLEALSHGQWVQRSELAKLTPEVAAAYAKKTTKTLTRDVNALRAMKLLEVEKERVRAPRYLVMAFRSATKDPAAVQEINQAAAEGENKTADQPRLPLV